MKNYIKSISLIFTILIISNFVFAQKGTLDLGVALMYNNSQVENSKMFTNLKSISGFSSMVKLEYEALERVRFAYGIGNITKGYAYEFLAIFPNGDDEKVLVENRLDYLSNQLTVVYRFGNKLSVFPEFGISFDALLKQEFITDPVENIGEQKYSNKELYRNLNTSLIYGVGVRYAISEKINAGVCFKVNHGLQSISDDEVKFAEGKPNNYLLGVECVWRLNNSSK